MNKKGFTLIELMASIALLGVLVTIAVVSFSKYLVKTRDTIYKDYEESLKGATTNYLLDHTGLLPAINDTNGSKIIANTLINEGYLESIKDPKNKSLYCNDNSYVIVTRKNDVDFNMNLEYYICLVCSKYKSSSCR